MKKVLPLLMLTLLKMNLMSMGQDMDEIAALNNFNDVEAALQKNPGVVKELTTYNRNILFQTQERSLVINELFLKKGADPNHADEFGFTPVTYNTSNYDLFMLYRKYGGKPVFDKKQTVDFLYSLVFDYVSLQQEGRLKIIRAVLESSSVGINKYYENGLSLAHLVVVNYLTYSENTDFGSLIMLLKKHHLDFTRPVEKDFHNDETYPFKLKKGDTYKDIINKVKAHASYNGRNPNDLMKLING